MKPTPAAYALDLCARIAAFTDVPGTITRLFLSPATRQVHALLRAEMQALGMQVRVDAAGNLRGLYPASQPPTNQAAPILLLGSHIDTVPDAGAFDGILGVAIPLALLRALDGERLPFAIEVIAFAEEEGIRFRMPFIGSRALAGSLGVEELSRTDSHGIRLDAAIRHFGLDPEALTHARLTPGTFAFLEVHLEQGPVLEALNLPLGVVTSIIGQTRLELTFAGRANHAGTTPMPLRQDALAAAAAWISRVEQHARATDGLVSTVGVLKVEPCAANVIPGKVLASLDVRHANDARRAEAVQALLEAASREAAARGVSLSHQETSRQDAVPMDDHLCTLFGATNPKPHRMVSGAGHDAMILAPHVPAAMLFVRTPAGVSHHPEEAVEETDVAMAIDVLQQMLRRLGHAPGVAEVER